MRVLVACEFSGTVREAFAAKGHDSWSCDLLPTEIPGQHYQCDLMEVLYDSWDLIIAHPPCTYLTNTGNRWMKPELKHKFPDRERQRAEAIDFFMRIANAPCEKIAIENPAGVMSTVYRKPDQVIYPYQFGHNFSKRTCLWLKGLGPLVPTDIVEPEFVVFNGKKYSKHHQQIGAGRKGRAKERSRTPRGIALAMAEQWG